MIRLTNPIRPYAWGSRTALARLTGRAVPSAQPEAELWMGAHPSAPSVLCPDQGEPLALTEAIARDPVTLLGPSVAARFGGRLPFLLKILAAEQPLSLQAHPDARQAQEGYARESALASECAQRNYADPNHKPELLVAVTEFTALCGFRDPQASAELLACFDVPQLAPVIAVLSEGSVEARLRSAMSRLLCWPADQRSALVGAVRAAAGSLARHRDAPAAGALAASLGQHHPDDIGVIVALLLNQIHLAPDEAVFMPPGHLHTYLRGVGVEVMATSDNVVRGGLTVKRVDVTELLRLLRYEVLADPVVRPVALGPGLVGWPAPVAEFELVKASTDATHGPITIKADGPRILVCLRGRARLRSGEQVLCLGAGESVFVSAAQPAVEVSGEAAVVFQSSPGLFTSMIHQAD